MPRSSASPLRVNLCWTAPANGLTSTRPTGKGLVGGYNIGAPYATEWRDTHIRITGPGVWDLKRAFADF